jgi:hypothetical protein
MTVPVSTTAAPADAVVGKLSTLIGFCRCGSVWPCSRGCCSAAVSPA